MVSVKKWFKSTFRPFRDFLFTCYGFSYDLYRYARYSGYKGFKKDPEKRDYKAVKIYHRLEKSLAFRERDKNAGRGAVEDLLSLLKHSGKNEALGFHERISLSVLDNFGRESDVKFEESLENNCFGEPVSDIGGIVSVTRETLDEGILQEPEKFFFSRYSVRDFSQEKVSSDLVKRALSLAMKTPSVCNRQGWYVYHTDSRKIIDDCLSHQNGNKGFGHEVPSLVILAADLKAFDTAGERYQPWIDGGMFAMSLVYALHSLGISSCCLNWSKTPGSDLRFRRLFSIRPHHEILMMLALGYPKQDLKVCYSARRPVDSIYEYWG